MIFIGTCVQCTSSVCGVRWSNKGTALERACGIGTVSSLQVLTAINITTHEELEVVTFLCKYNDCNHIDVVSKIQANIKAHYDLTPLRNALGLNGKPAEMTMGTLSSSVISSTVTHSSTAISSSAVNISASTTSIVVTPSSAATSLSTANTSISATSTAITPSSSTSAKSYCSTWRSQNTIMMVALGALMAFLAGQRFYLY